MKKLKDMFCVITNDIKSFKTWQLLTKYWIQQQQQQKQQPERDTNTTALHLPYTLNKILDNENEEVVKCYSFEIKSISKYQPVFSHKQFVCKQILTRAI
jgi:hypothetical protein